MPLNFIKKCLQSRFKTTDELYRKRSRWGEINEIFGRQIISSDSFRYNIPLSAILSGEAVKKING